MQRIVEKEKSFMSSMLNILVIIIAICLLLYMGFYSGMKDLYFQVIVGYESDHIQSSQSIIRELYDSKLKNLKSDAEKKAEMFSAEINQNNKVKQVEILKEIPLEKDYINYMYYSEGRLTSAYAEYGEYAEEFGIVEIIEKLEVGNTVINPYFDNNDNYVLTIASVCEKKGKKEAFLIQVDAYAMSRWIEDAYEYFIFISRWA